MHDRQVSLAELKFTLITVEEFEGMNVWALGHFQAHTS